MKRYEDMLHLAHPVSAKRARMSQSDRAAQFSPFAALVGYEDAIDEAGRLTDAPITLTESSVEQINACLVMLQANIHQSPEAQITYFCPDERKAGGSYVTRKGVVCRIDQHRQVLLLESTIEIAFSSIVDICLLDKR